MNVYTTICSFWDIYLYTELFIYEHNMGSTIAGNYWWTKHITFTVWQLPYMWRCTYKTNDNNCIFKTPAVNTWAGYASYH